MFPHLFSFLIFLATVALDLILGISAFFGTCNFEFEIFTPLCVSPIPPSARIRHAL